MVVTINKDKQGNNVKVIDLPYNHNLLDAFGPNDVYRKCHKEMTADFEKVYQSFMEVDISSYDEASRVGIIDQKTHMLVSFVSGHLNAFDPNSSFFTKFNELVEGNTPKEKKDKSALSGLILPEHLR